jgi:hypothetical protein
MQMCNTQSHHSDRVDRAAGKHLSTQDCIIVQDFMQFIIVNAACRAKAMQTHGRCAPRTSSGRKIRKTHKATEVNQCGQAAVLMSCLSCAELVLAFYHVMYLCGLWLWYLFSWDPCICPGQFYSL